MENSFIIQNLLQQDEGVRLELKSQADLDQIAITITALINTQGGDMIIGVDKNKNVVGVENAFEQCSSIQKDLVERIKPTAPISVKVINYKKKDVILISVWEGAKKPYSFNNIIYNRDNEKSIKVQPDKLFEIINDRKETDSSWERMPVLGAELSDLDESEIDNTIEFYKKYKEDAHFEDIEDFLVQIGLIENGNITNACLLLFGENPTRFIPQAKIRLTIYPDKDTGNKYLGDKIFDKNIFQNISKIFEYLDIEFGKGLLIKGLLREETFNYPRLAMRESILNAIVHRDYNSVKSFLQISIYSDRTEVTNYGGLPEGITIKDLKVEHNSILRNPDIAKLCFIRRHIELLGGGTLRMIKDCRVNKFKVPEWKENNSILTVIFPNVSHNRKDEGVIEGITEGISKEAIAKIEGITEGVTEGVTEEVKSKTRKILMLLYKEEGLNTNDIEAATGIPVKTLERYIKTLKEEGVISYKGAGKTGGYYIIDKALSKNTIDTKEAGKDKPGRSDDGVSDDVSDGVNTLLNDGVTDGVIDGVTDGARLEIIKITEFVLVKEGVNAMDIAIKRGKSKPSIERYVRTAKEVGIIEFKGASKTGGYYLTAKMKSKLK